MGWYAIGQDVYLGADDVYLGAEDEEDDFVGDDIDELLSDEVGARRPRFRGMMRRGGGVQRMVKRSTSFRAPRVQRPVARELPFSGLNELPIGVDSGAGTIAAATQARIFTRPQLPAYRPIAYVVPDAIAPSFIVDDLLVGNQSQFAASGALPAQTFSNLSAQKVGLKGTTCQGGLDLVSLVTNTSGGVLRFRANWNGAALMPANG